MSYSETVSGILTLVAAQEAASALHALTPTHPIEADPARMIGTLLKDWLPLEQVDIITPDEQGEGDGRQALDLYGFGKIHKPEEAFSAISKHVRGWIEFSSDGHFSRVRFTGGAPINDSGAVVYDCDDRDHVDGIWIGQMESHIEDERDIIVTATSYAGARDKLATRCRRFLRDRAYGDSGDPDALTATEAIDAWTTRAVSVRWSIYSQEPDA